MPIERIDTSFNWQDLQDYTTQPSDATRYNTQFGTTKPIDKNVNPYETLSKGSYRLTIGKPQGVLSKTFERQVTFASYFDDSGKYQQHKVSVDSIVYDNINNKVIVDITLYDNPIFIPIFVIWGAVAVVVAVTGAIAVNSILEKIEVLFAGEKEIDPATGKERPRPGIFDNLLDTVKGPIGIGIILIL